jgi:hypothetical protein
MRLTLTFICVAGLALAANTTKEITYVEGTLTGYSVSTDAKLELASSKHLVLHGKDAADVAIPYANVISSEQKTVVLTPEKEPLYKVWDLAKRLAPPDPVEKVTLQFVDKAGSKQSVTFETDKKTAGKVMASVKQASDKRASDQGAWWGDRAWKTKRNQSEWGGAGPIASRE